MFAGLSFPIHLPCVLHVSPHPSSSFISSLPSHSLRHSVYQIDIFTTRRTSDLVLESLWRPLLEWATYVSGESVPSRTVWEILFVVLEREGAPSRNTSFNLRFLTTPQHRRSEIFVSRVLIFAFWDIGTPASRDFFLANATLMRVFAK